jgi:transcriptional regulator of arginine metabolism
MEKAERHGIIRDLIAEHAIMSQEDLKNHLQQAGYSVAQATLSRDIKELGIIKTSTGYQMPKFVQEQPAQPYGNRIGAKPIPAKSVTGLEFGTGLAVMRTTPGHASMVAAIIDAASLAPIMGTIAGDDTIMLILRPAFSNAKVYEALATLVDGLPKP